MPNANKSKFLGIPYGTACNRLRKLVLFDLVQKLKLDTCYKCMALIQSADDLTIEHKAPWENRSVARFWDLENIAFSHLACNVQHINGGGGPRKLGPPGTAWCGGHKSFLPQSDFRKHKNYWDGFYKLCRSCERNSRNRRKSTSKK